MTLRLSVVRVNYIRATNEIKINPRTGIGRIVQIIASNENSRNWRENYNSQEKLD
jgi:hypothetical protein